MPIPRTCAAGARRVNRCRVASWAGYVGELRIDPESVAARSGRWKKSGFELDDEQLVGPFRACIDYGLPNIRNINSEQTHADWNAGDIHVAADSIYLCVLHPVDGHVAVEVHQGAPGSSPHALTQRFERTVALSHGTLILHVPLENARLGVRTEHHGNVQLRIAADHPWRPAKVRLDV